MQGFLVDYSRFHSSWSGDGWNRSQVKADEILCSSGVQWYHCSCQSKAVAQQNCLDMTATSLFLSLGFPSFSLSGPNFSKWLVLSTLTMAGDVLSQSRMMPWFKRGQMLPSKLLTIFLFSQFFNSGKIKVKMQTEAKKTNDFAFSKKVFFVSDIVICYIALEDYKPHPRFALLFSSGILTSLLNNTCPHLGCFS